MLAELLYIRVKKKAGPIPSEHRLLLGLQGSLIPFAPLAFVSQRQNTPSYLPSPSVFLNISTDFTPTC